jgi:tetratricopeptide (TPR) repeat protein
MKWALGVWDTKNKKQRFFEESDAEMTQGVILDDTGTHLLRWASTVRERKIVETFVEFRDLSKVIHRIPVTTNRAVLALAMSGDGKWLAAGDHAGKVWIWDRATGKPLHDGTVLCSNRTGLEALAFSPDGKLLAGSTRTHTALWDVLSGHELTVMTATPQRDWDPGMTPRLAWSPDGQRLASSGWDNSLALWEGGALPDEQEKLKGYQARLTDWQLAHAAKSLHRREKPAVEYQLQQIALAGNLTQRHRVKRADLFVQLGEVSKARADLEQALKHESLDQLFTEWFHLAALLAIEGNVEEYRRLCEKFAAGKTPQVHFGQLHDVLNSCTFLPNALRDQRVLLPLADSAQKQADEIFLRHNPEAKVGAKVLFGAEAQLAYFRAGEYTKILTHSELADNPRENLGAIDLLTLYLLAMSYQHTGHIEKARQWFKRAEDTFSRADKIREEKKERFLEGLTWVQHARTLQLQKEARQLLGRLPPAK